MKRFSIIVPAFNAADTLPRCLDSIIAQTTDDWECIVINDGSIDDTRKVLREYAKKDKRFIVINHKNNFGVSAARNEGLENATGEWVTFVDADDWVQPDKLEVCYRDAVEHNVDIVMHAMLTHNSDGSSSTKGKNFRGLHNIATDQVTLSSNLYDIGYGPNKMFRRSLIETNELRFPDCDYCEDLIFSIMAYAHAGKLYNNGLRLYHYYRHEGSLAHTPMSQARRQKLITATFRMVQMLVALPNGKYIIPRAMAFLGNCIRRGL